MAYQNTDPHKVDFAVFPNQHKKSDRHPNHTGDLEISRPFLKTLVEEAKKGVFPIPLQVALWENTAQGSGRKYMGGKITLNEWKIKNRADGSEEKTAPISEPEDDLPF